MKNLEVSCNLPLFSHQYILLYYCFRCINLLLHVYHLSTTTSCVSSLYYYFMCIVSLPLLLHVYRLSTTTSCVSSLFSASYLLQLVYAVSQKVIYLRTMFRHPYSFTCSLFLLFHSGALWHLWGNRIWLPELLYSQCWCAAGRSIHLPIYLSIYLSICLYLFIYLSIYLTIYLSIYLSLYLFICLSIYLSLYLSIFLSIYFYLCLSKSIYLFIYLSIYLFIYLSIILSI